MAADERCWQPCGRNPMLENNGSRGRGDRIIAAATLMAGDVVVLMMVVVVVVMLLKRARYERAKASNRPKSWLSAFCNASI